LFPNSHLKYFWGEFCSLPFSVHAQNQHSLFSLIVSSTVGALNIT
jgi:hypothetical protein